MAFSCKRRGFCPSCGARRMTESAALLVDAVLPEEPVRQWVLSVPFPLRFLFAAEPAAMGQVLAIVYRALASHLIRKAGLTRATGQTGAYTLENSRPRFRRVPPPSPTELDAILTVVTARIAGHLERRGLLIRDLESSHLTRAPGEDAALEILQGHSITYRIALGPHEGRKAFTLQTVPAREPTTKRFLATHAGFSLHAGVAALKPTPRVHLTRYHGVFAPHSRWRAKITPAGRGSGVKAADTRTPAECHRAMSWAQRLKRVFQLDLQSCEGCGGQVRVIACIEDPLVIGKILEHRERSGPETAGAGRRPEVRGPPRGALELG